MEDINCARWSTSLLQSISRHHVLLFPFLLYLPRAVPARSREFIGVFCLRAALVFSPRALRCDPGEPRRNFPEG